MSEEKESSVLFSLKELMSLEEDRIKNEEAERAAAAAAAERARADAERHAREAEEARIRAEEERRRAEEQRTREEAARLEAIRVAEVEKARLEAEQKARLEAMAAQQHHERSMAAISHDQSKKNLRKILIGVAVAVPLIGGGIGYMVYQDYQQKQALIAAERQKNAEAEERQKKLQADLEAQSKKVAMLIEQLSSANDEKTRLEIQKKIAEEQAKTDALKKGGAAAGGPAPAKSPGKACNCTPGDPLCSCL